MVIAEKVTVDRLVDALAQYGGTVSKTSLSKNAEAELCEALVGSPGLAAVAGGGRALRASAGSITGESSTARR